MTTRRTHPPTLLTLVRRALEDEGLATRGDVVLVAVSGGPDSMALLHALAWLRPKLGYELVAHGVDHGLRAEATAELNLAEAFARNLGVPFARTRVRVPEGGNLQARARHARYEALRAAAHAHGARRIATAHHADDRAETVLMRLLRGTGARGLAVLPPRSGVARSGFETSGCESLIRPMIRARRADVLAHVARHAIPHAHDPSNENPRFLRTRIRREVLPLLEELNPGIVAHLCALADQLAGGDAPAPSPVVVNPTGPSAGTLAAKARPPARPSGARDPARGIVGELAAYIPALATAVDRTRGVRATVGRKGTRP
jgi:tRNA(Ile)-lysidine synthase